MKQKITSKNKFHKKFLSEVEGYDITDTNSNNFGSGGPGEERTFESGELNDPFEVRVVEIEASLLKTYLHTSTEEAARRCACCN